MTAILNMLAGAGFNDAQYLAYVITSIVIIVVMLVVSAITILLILFQQSNSDGVQGITGSSETFFGKNKGQSIESKFKKWSWICLAILGVLAIVFYIIQVLAP